MDLSPGRAGAGRLVGVLVLVTACGNPPVTVPPAVPDAALVGPAAAWIDRNAYPFEGSHLALPPDDLEFLRAIVGDARIVALGEKKPHTRSAA